MHKINVKNAVYTDFNGNIAKRKIIRWYYLPPHSLNINLLRSYTTYQLIYSLQNFHGSMMIN